MEQEYINEVCNLFWQMYFQPKYAMIDNFKDKTGKTIVVFHNVVKNRAVKVYMENGILKPFFGNMEN